MAIQPTTSTTAPAATSSTNTTNTSDTSHDAQQQLQAITSRTHNNDSLENTYDQPTGKVVLDGTNSDTDSQLFQPPDQPQNTIADQAKHASVLFFKPNIDLAINPPTRCNTISSDTLSKCLTAAYLIFEGATSFKTQPELRALFNTALAWHIAEYRPTAVTHGKVLDVEAQILFDALINKDRGITIRRIARAWSLAISNVLYHYANLSPPIFTTQCNDTFADPHTRIAVAPFFFDGVDPGTIPVNLSRLVATGLAYSKRQATNSPFSLHKRPAFVTQKTEDLNMALQFTG